MSSKKDSAKPKGSNNGSAGNSTPNAWSRPLKTRPPPGLDGHNKTKSIKDKILRERFLHLSLSMVGQKVTVTQTNGTVLEGIFHTFTPFDSQPLEKRNKYVLKTVQVIVAGSGDFVEIEKGSTVIVPIEKVTFLHAKSMRLETSNGIKEGFRTDVEISFQQSNKGRELVSAGNAWTSAGTSGNGRSEALAGGLESGTRNQSSSVPLRGNIGEWDQFQANEELFNVKGSYDENLYTTELDKSLMDRSKQQEAERLAREIESAVSANIHIAEERNQLIEGDYDEEDRYSGVLREKSEARNKDIPEKMNYAAAAAASAQRKPAPPGLAKAKDEEEKKDTKDAPSSMDNLKTVPSVSASTSELTTNKLNIIQVEHKEQSKMEESPVAEDKTVMDKIELKDEEGGNDPETSKEKEPDTKLKLNANAKSFSFNPTAKTFTPTFGSNSTPGPVHESHIIDPHSGMAIIPQMMGHYMSHPMVVQPGMIPGMHNQFTTIRYPGQYSGMEHHMGHIQPHHQPQHHIMTSHIPPYMQPDGGSNFPPGSEPTHLTEVQPAHSLQVSQLQPPQQGVQMQYPASAYYGGGMTMHPAHSRAHHMGGYQQIIAGPQQMPSVPGRNPYQPIYGMPQPLPQMPNVAPYYPAPSHTYPPYMMDDDYRGGRGGRGRGISGRRKPGGRAGRGGRGYHNTYTSNGQNTPQNGLQSFEGQASSASTNGEVSEPIQDSAPE